MSGKQNKKKKKGNRKPRPGGYIGSIWGLLGAYLDPELPNFNFKYRMNR